MPIQISWGNDLNAQNTFIQKLIDKEVSKEWKEINVTNLNGCLLYTSPSPRDPKTSRMPSSA